MEGSPGLVRTLRQCTVNGWRGEAGGSGSGVSVKEDRGEGMNDQDREDNSDQWQSLAVA
jgi:hypothetical protein